jgi:hypothetical protein
MALVRAGPARHRETAGPRRAATGHDRRVRIAGHTAFTVTTSDGEAAWGRVRAPLPDTGRRERGW